MQIELSEIRFRSEDLCPMVDVQCKFTLPFDREQHLALKPFKETTLNILTVEFRESLLRQLIERYPTLAELIS